MASATTSSTATATPLVVTVDVRRRAPAGRRRCRRTSTTAAATAGTTPNTHADTAAAGRPTQPTCQGDMTCGQSQGYMPDWNSPDSTPARVAPRAATRIHRRTRAPGRPAGNPSNAIARAGSSRYAPTTSGLSAATGVRVPMNQAARASAASHSQRPVALRGARAHSHRPTPNAAAMLTQLRTRMAAPAGVRSNTEGTRHVQWATQVHTVNAVTVTETDPRRATAHRGRPTALTRGAAVGRSAVMVTSAACQRPSQPASGLSPVQGRDPEHRVATSPRSVRVAFADRPRGTKSDDAGAKLIESQKPSLFAAGRRGRLPRRHLLSSAATAVLRPGRHLASRPLDRPGRCPRFVKRALTLMPSRPFGSVWCDRARGGTRTRTLS